MASLLVDYDKNDQYVALYNYFSDLVMPPNGYYYYMSLQEITSSNVEGKYITKILENFYNDIDREPDFSKDTVLDILILLIDDLTNKGLIANFRQKSVEYLKETSLGNLDEYEEVGDRENELYKAHKHASKRKQVRKMHTKLMKKLNPKPESAAVSQSASKSDTPCPVARPAAASAQPVLIKPKPKRFVKKSNKRKRGKIGGKKSKRKTRRKKSKKNKRKRKSRTRKH